MTRTTECPIDQLQAFVDDALDGALHDTLIAHLDQCEDCRRRLEGIAASADDWNIAGEALSDVDDHPASGVPEDDRTLPSVSAEAPFDTTALLQLLAPSDDPRAAGRIGAFEITGVIGTGGMGIVLKARDPALDRFVAVKLLAPHLASSVSARKRFAREARAAAAVIHDNVIAIYQVAHWNDLPYLVMPYLPDPSLQQRIASDGPLDVESVLSIGLQIARGLSAAHAQGLVHRDVKPANVLLSKGTERAVITDFGLARASDDASLTRAGMLAGTPHYMSPEQARGESVDQKSDLFSLGSVLFEMITGRPPVDCELGSDTIRHISSATLPSLREITPETPDWLVRLVDWLHRSDPRRRPESAGQVAQLLETCLAHHRQPEQTPLPEQLVSRNTARRSHRLWASVTAVVVIVLLAAFALHRPTTDPATDSVAHPREHDESLSADTAPDGPTAAPVEDSLSLPVPNPEWDEFEVQLDELSRFADDVALRSSQHWDRLPANPSQSVTDPDQPPRQKETE